MLIWVFGCPHLIYKCVFKVVFFKRKNGGYNVLEKIKIKNFLYIQSYDHNKHALKAEKKFS